VEITEQAAWDQRYSGPDLLWGAGPNRFVADETAALPPGRAADLGTGEGRNAVWLAGRGWRVTAVDFSADLDRAAGWPPNEGSAWTRCRPTCRPGTLRPGGYDLVLIAYLHLPSAGLARVFRAAAAAVAPGGTLLVIGHDRDNITRGHGPQDPDRLYTPALVTAELGGFGISRAEQVPRPVRTPEGEQTAIDTLVRAQCPA
jgi:SAM-dependent methyltransferase